MFERGARYRHVNFNDVDLVVYDEPIIADQKVNFYALYYNRLYKCYCVVIPDLVSINVKDFPNWTLIEKCFYEV